MSSQPRSAGTTATRPAAAAGSATAWSTAIRGSRGHSSVAAAPAPPRSSAAPRRRPGPARRAGRAARSAAPRTCRRSTGSRRRRGSPRPRRRPASRRTRPPGGRRRGRRAPRRAGCSRTPVAAKVGVMPSVTSQSSCAAATARPTAASKASVSAITWSAANEPTTASGSRRSTTAAARPIAAIESRGDGSASTAPGVEPGQLLAHGGAVGLAGHDERPGRRPAAPAGRRSPGAASGRSPVRSWRNLGRPTRESGHSRVPAPPAGITAQK